MASKSVRAATTRLLSCVALGACMTATAYAQEVEQPVAAEQGDEIVVQGFRRSLARALEIKRESSGVVDSIVAEDIAKFPDNNLAESIQRIPGVAIARDQGEGRSLSVRGLGPDFTRVQLNGMEAQASTDGVAGGANRGRGFDFNVFASELFSRIDVNKTASARLPEGSLGATVDLYTGRPFDYNGFRLAVSAQGSYNDQSEKAGYRGAVLVSDRFANDTLGVLLSAAYSHQPIDVQGSNSGNWNQGSGDGGFCRPTTGTGGLCDVPAAELPAALTRYNLANSPSTYGPRLYRYAHSKGATDRLGLTGSLQWRPSTDTTLTLDVLFSKFETDRDDYFLQPIGFSRGVSQGGKPETLVRDIQVDANNTMVYGVFDNVDMRAEHAQDDFSTTFKQFTLSLEQTLSSSLKFSALAGMSDSKFDNYNDLTVQVDRFNVDGYSFDTRTTGFTRPQLNYGFDVANPANWYFGPRVLQPGGTGPTGPEIRFRPNYVENSYKVARGELAWNVAESVKLRAGGEYKQYEFEAIAYRYTGGELDWAAPSGGLAGLTDTFCGLGSIAPPAPTPTCWTVPNIDAFASAYGIYANTGRTTLSNTIASARGDNRAVTEKDVSIYGMVEFRGSVGDIGLRGDLGVRWVRTNQQSQFYTNVPVAVDPSGFLLTNVERSYDDWLPSMNLVIEPTDKLLVRLSAAKVMARPPLGNIAAATSVSVSGGSRNVSTGNVNLEPFRAKTFDASIEWYPAAGSIVSLGLFYKDISTYIQNLTIVAPYSTTGLPASLLTGTGAAASDDFNITNVVNTPGGPLKGLELNVQQQLTFLPGFFKNFGVLANYTYVESKIDYVLNAAAGTRVTADLLNLSKNSWNATLYYENGPFQARVSANHRDKFLRQVPGPNNQDVAGMKGTTYLDFSTSMKLTERLTASFEAINLTNETLFSWVDSRAERVEDYRLTGRQFFIGLRYNY